MKTVHLTVNVAVQVPDNTEIKDLGLNMNVKQITVMSCNMWNPVKGARVISYATVDQEEAE